MTGLSQAAAFRYSTDEKTVPVHERAAIIAQAESNSIQAGEYAPAFVLPRWDLGNFGFSDFLGSPAFLHFYAGNENSWRVQTQYLNLLEARLHRLGIGLVGLIAADPAAIALHCETASPSYPILVDWEPIALVARIYGFHRRSERPDVTASYLIDSRGVVRWKGFACCGERIDIPTIMKVVRSEVTRPFAVDF